MIQSDLFASADLVLALLCALAWVLLPQLGWVILVISLLPWALRLILGHFPFRRTTLDLPIGVFLITAGMGVWAAYDQSAAWEKFWWIVAACRLYYALAAQPKANFQTTALLIVAIAALLSLLFLFTFNWQEHPLLGPIDRIGLIWMGVRPTVKLPRPGPDFIGGLTAILAPLTLVLAIDTYRQGKKILFLVILTFGILLALGLLMSGERPAWAGLLLVISLWLGWQVCVWISHRIGHSPIMIALFGIAIISFSGIVILSLAWQQLVGLGSARIEEMINGSHLVLAYPFLGGGLASVPGLYSRYILNIQYLFIPYISNQYLNIAIEQGIFGLGSFIVVLVGAFFGLVNKTNAKTRTFPAYNWAIAAGIIILTIHSLVEDVLYSNWPLIFLYILPGLAVILFPDTRLVRISRKWALLSLGLLSILLIIFNNPLRSTWFANLGAIQMARVQLQGWPEQRITSEKLLSQIDPAEASFDQAIRINSGQPTANYRIGLIATERRDFEIANDHLRIAFDKRPYHRGIHKALGFSYAWLGEIEIAGTFLRTIPEAPYELGIYSQWWQSENRSDLSGYAIQTKEWIEQN